MPIYKMLIVYDSEKKSVVVDGPFGDLITFMGMLEAAKINYNEVLERSKQQQRIIPTPMIPPGKPS